MSEIRFAEDKPKDCKYCAFWRGNKKGCQLGEAKCYYILPEKAKAEAESPCDGCSYGSVHPCIGYCLRELWEGTRR